MTTSAEEFKDGRESHKWWCDTLTEVREWFDEKYWNGWKAIRQRIKLDRGDHWDDEFVSKDSKSSLNPDDQITLNYVQRYARAIRNYICYKTPKVLVKPMTPEDYVPARLCEESVASLWRRKKMKKMYKKAELDCVVTGMAVAKVHFIGEGERDHTKDKGKDGEIEYRPTATEGDPLPSRVSPLMLFWDPASQDPEDARWLCEMHHVSYRYVTRNERFIASVRKRIKAKEEGYRPRLLEETLGTEKEGKVKELCLLYEVWDKAFNRHYIFCDGVEEPLVEEEWPYPYLEGEFPYVFQFYNELINEHLPQGYSDPVVDSQFEVNRIRSAEFVHRRTSLGGQYAHKGLDEKTAIEPFRKGHMLIDVSSGPEEVPPAGQIAPIQTAKLDPAQYSVDNICQNDMKILGYMDDLFMAQSAGNRVSAREIQQRTNFQAIGLSDFVEKADDFVVGIVRLMIKHIQNNWQADKMIEVAGPLGEYWNPMPANVKSTQSPDKRSVFLSFPGGMTKSKAEFDFEIESSSLPKKDPDVMQAEFLQWTRECREWILLAQQTQQPLDNIGGVNAVEILRKSAEGFGIKDLPRFITAAGIIPPPMQTQTALSGGPVASPDNMINQQSANPVSAVLGAVNGQEGGITPQ